MAEGQSGLSEIKRLEKGDTTRTSAHADVMNEIIDRLNAQSNARIVRSGIGDGKVIQSDSNVIYDLGSIEGGCGDEDPPANGTYLCGSIDGVKQWIATETCDCSSGTAAIDGGGA